jgi:hypothetical protein
MLKRTKLFLYHTINLGENTMGKQIQFFMTDKDFFYFVKYVLDCGDVFVDFHLTVHDTTDKFIFKESQLWIWNNELKMVVDDDNTLQTSSSELIEFSLGRIKTAEKKVFASRLYIDMYYLEGDKFLKKSDKLDSLFRNYKKFIMSNFKKSIDKKTPLYIGPDAYKLNKNGWKMMQGPLYEEVFDSASN